MQLSLKMKLTISYVLISIFLVSSLYMGSKYFLEQKFQSYIIGTQEIVNQDIVNSVSNEFGENGETPNIAILENIGKTALSQGLVLMVNDMDNTELFCMSTLDSQICDNMIESMQSQMASIYPHFKGEYTQKKYDIIKNSTLVGTVTLGYYGPFYYNAEDIQFLDVLNKIFISVAAVFMLIAAILGIFMANRISKPIRKVIDQAREIESGNYTKRLTTDSKTVEINQLMHSINTLAITLDQQQISKKNMARDYAHEFRTPLASLQLNLEAMIDGIWEPTKERLESCRQEILRLTRMISEIDKIVKIENDSLILQSTKFDLVSVIGQVVLNYQAEISAKHIKLDKSNSNCEIYADKDKITQMMINLLSNAIKYTDDNGTIKIIAKKDKRKVELIISDTGIGISPEDLPNIFEHLYRADKSRTRDTGGSGIGLSVVKAIVEAHGGEIEAKSELNKGSEVTVRLPIL